VSTGLRPSSLLLVQGGDEFAAEVGDIGDHAAPDQAGTDPQASRTRIRLPSRAASNSFRPPLVCS
jgi:hypothetical protein